MSFTEEQIENLQNHVDEWDKGGEPEYTTLSGYNVLDVRRAGEKYVFEYEDAESSYAIRSASGAQRFADILEDLAVTDNHISWILKDAGYAADSGKKISRKLDGFIDEKGRLHDPLEDDFQRLAEDIRDAF